MSQGLTRGGVLALLFLAVVSSGLVSGCGGESSGGGGTEIAGDQFRLSGTQRDAQFAVGSESFTEQEALGNIAIQVLEAADATVIDRKGLGGNEAVAREDLKENGIRWLDPAPGNDTYAIAASQ